MLVQTLGGLYVVRRSFKSKGVLFNAGEVIENITEVSYWKARISDRDILSLFPNQDAVNLSWIQYLEDRTGKLLDKRIYATITDKKYVADKLADIKALETPVVPNPKEVKPVTPKASATTTSKVTPKVIPVTNK